MINCKKCYKDLYEIVYRLAVKVGRTEQTLGNIRRLYNKDPKTAYQSVVWSNQLLELKTGYEKQLA